MEYFNALTLERSHFSSKTSLFRPNHSHTHRFRRTQLRNNQLYPYFPLKVPFSSHQSMQITSHFGRASKRRNYLRRKLIQEQQKVRLDNAPIDKGSIFQPPVNNFDEIEVIEDTQVLGSSDNVEKSKLFENWVDMYKRDAEFWGIGSGPVFTVFQDKEGNVERVSVNEDEILRRSRIEPSLFKKEGNEDDFIEINSKISYAKRLAVEIEKGEYKLPRNSSIAKCVISGQESGFIKELRSVIFKPQMVPQLPRIGFVMICSLFVFSLVKKVFMVKNNGVELTREEKKMLKRKLKSRMEKEKEEAGNVEILPKVANQLTASTVRPQLDKQELMNSISKIKVPGQEVKLLESSRSRDAETRNFNSKVQEIKELARKAREVEKKNREESENVNKGFSSDSEGLGESVNNQQSLSDGGSLKPRDINATKKPPFENDPALMSIGVSGNGTSSLCNPGKRESVRTSHLMDTGVSESCNNPTRVPIIVDDPPNVDIESLVEGETLRASKNSYSQSHAIVSNIEGTEDGVKNQLGFNSGESSSLQLKDMKEENELCEDPNDKNNSPIKMTPKIILTVKEAREYLSQKTVRGEPDRRSLRLEADNFEPSIDEDVPVKESKMMQNQKELCDSSDLDTKSVTKSAMNARGNPCQNKIEFYADTMQSIPLKTEEYNDKQMKYDSKRPVTAKEYNDTDRNREATPVKPKKSWMEQNFQDFEPIVKKIGDGFRENYMIAKDKVQEELNLRSDINLPGDDSELEWMKDDSLREIVFQVRENELMGRDPFHMMDAEDKQAFFEGLEKKVEKENEKLSNLHELIHSRIENLDYGADGISLYDPPEKVIPRWRGSTFDKDPEFLNYTENHLTKFSNQNTGVSRPTNQNLHDTLRKSADLASDDGQSSPAIRISSKAPQSQASKNPKTVIDSSNGFSRAGKKSGKEYWQHTKKWSREFLELYNAETDPEVKSIMKDMGKDLNRWITDKEIQEAADLMTQIPKKKRRYIEKKIEKLKREMEMFGPQAVVSKYREYAEEEEDYLWWLDLPFVLCIELYTNEDGVQKVGFYSLEMAEDLELDPKQYHVIAFEDPGDSKSFCYIIQAHLELLGKGNAFVVARPPKDAFREAKTNGFSVTVIRKGELQLSVDQTLEEVEEQISEIGSKVYHDKIMRERSVDMGSLMKGVFGSSKPANRGRSKRMQKKLSASDN